MKRTKAITRKLYIEELERPATALSVRPDGLVTTLAIGEEALKSK